MIELRVYDRARAPRHWTEIIRLGQFAAFAKRFDTGAPCDANGRPFPSIEDTTCVLFDALAEADAFCHEQVEIVPDIRFEIFDSTGRAHGPLLVIVHPSKEAQLEGNPREIRLRKQGALLLFAVATACFWYNFRHGLHFQIFPTLIGINLLVVALRLVQLNSSYADAERARKRRLEESERASGRPTVVTRSDV